MGVWAVILGILAVICALFATFLFGTMGAVIAGVLGVGAIVLAILRRKKAGKGGISGIVIGVLAIILAILLSNFWSGLFSEAHKKALEYKPDGLWAQVSDDPNGGIWGIVRKMPQDEATMRQLMDELSELNKITGNEK